jgi:uncharacterized protein YciI
VKFINWVKYCDLDKIAATRQAHFAYADGLREHGELAIGGPLVDDEGRRIGLLFLYEATSRDAALAFAREDPFARAGALSSCEVTEWRLRGVDIDLLARANRAGDHADSKQAQIRLFANYAKYVADKSKLEAVRPAHWEYDQGLERVHKLALAGPFANDEGGLFVYRADDRAEALSHLEQDPFSVEGVLASFELLEWVVEGVNPALLGRDFPSS